MLNKKQIFPAAISAAVTPKNCSSAPLSIPRGSAKNDPAERLGGLPLSDNEAIPPTERLKTLEQRCACAEQALNRCLQVNQALGIARWDITTASGDLSDLKNLVHCSAELSDWIGNGTAEFTDTLASCLNRLHPGDRENVLGALRACASDKEKVAPLALTHRLRTNSGEYLHVRSVASAVRDTDGTLLRLSGGAENITDLIRRQNRPLNHEKISDIINQTAITLLSRDSHLSGESMKKLFYSIADAFSFSKMSIFRNADDPTGSHFSQVFFWQEEALCSSSSPANFSGIPFSSDPWLEALLSTGQSVNGSSSLLPTNSFLHLFGCKALLVLPIFDDKVFWGFTAFYREFEEEFSKQHVDLLHSFSLLLANFIIRQDESLCIRKLNRRHQMMLDAMPISVTVWDQEHRVIDCSQNTVALFGFESKKECMDRLTDFTPEYQPCGKTSADVMAETSAKAFETGSCRFEWTQHTTNHEPILLDAIAIRIDYDDRPVLMLYSRDIRKEKELMDSLSERDKMLIQQAHWYKSILDAAPLPISVTDVDMKWKFVNKSAEKLLGKNSEDMIGLHCSNWGTHICNTEDCGIACARRGLRQTFFKQDDRSYKVDIETLKSLDGSTSGYILTVQDITEVERLARQQADTENAAKSLLLANVSHEMRTSLNAVLGFSEIILERRSLSKENAECLDKIYKAGTTMLHIVNDLLDISKIDAGKFNLIPAKYNVADMISDAISQHLLKIRSRPIRFTLDIPDNMPLFLCGDSFRVRQIISNLLSNAFKYTEHGSVNMRFAFERIGKDVWLSICVSDTGVGIRPRDLDYMFADYSRLDEAVGRKTIGTGLGLSITKKLTELMDGSIAVESIYGKGSVFTIKVCQQWVDDFPIGAKKVHLLQDFRYTEKNMRHGSLLDRAYLPDARVLIIDDNQTNLDIAHGLLQPYGMQIDGATSAREGLRILREQGTASYHAVFMDPTMPGIDGIEATRIIRNDFPDAYAKKIPIIALTANAAPKSKEQFLRHGFNDFLSKPIDVFRLDEVVRRWIQQDASSASGLGSLERRKGLDRRSGTERRKTADRRIGDRRRNPDLRSPQPPQDDIDLAQGSQFFGGREAFLSILNSYAVNTLPLLESIAQVSDESLPLYAIIVHGIKSSSHSIFAKEIGDFAESLEYAAKDKNLAFVLLRNPLFLDATRQLIRKIKTLIERQSPPACEPSQRNAPGKDVLTRLRDACDNYDMNAIDDAILAMKQHTYLCDSGLSEWILENVAQLNYTQVSAKITECFKEMNV